MLSFTRAGAVATPTTVQIRLTRRFPGRVAAGAPLPSRSLTFAELEDNLRYFTHGLRGPRTRPCTALVLSGLGLTDFEDLERALALARELGFERITAHTSAKDPALGPLARLVDAVAVTIRRVDQVQVLGRIGDGLNRTTVVVPLVGEVLAAAGDLAGALAAAGPGRVVLTWPFPPAEDVPGASEAAAVLPEMLEHLDRVGVIAGIKGLPACVVGSEQRLWRSQNRWYVDAEHQRAQALKFFPDVVRFEKADVCRFCRVGGRCDGAPGAWMDAGLVGPLRPIEPSESDVDGTGQ